MDLTYRLTVLRDSLAICKLAPDLPIPPWAVGGDILAFIRTQDELSIVCKDENIPADVQSDQNWRVLRVDGPLDLSQIGVLKTLSRELAEANISIFALSTFDTDYILVKGNTLDSAVQALKSRGHEVDSI